MNSTTSELQCQICLGSFSKADESFPILSLKECGNENICNACLMHLNSSTGETRNQLLRITSMSLHQIEDVVLLRKAAATEHLQIAHDSELSGSELRLKYSLDEKKVEKARQRYENTKEALVEVSLHDELDKTSTPSEKKGIAHKSPIVDKKLFSAMESIITESERQFITTLLVSGDTTKLAQAALIISELKQLNSCDSFRNKHSIEGVEQKALEMAFSQKDLNHRQYWKKYPLPDRLPTHALLTADFDVYAKSGKILKFQDDGWDGSIADAFVRVHNTNVKSRSRVGKKKVDKGRSQQQFVSPFDYIDDHEISSSSDSLDDSDDDRIDPDESEDEDDQNTPSYRGNRVIVKAARKQAAWQGIRTGDVVTHVNGEAFTGTADELKELINSFYLNGDPKYTFTMVFNAEQTTADALRQHAIMYHEGENS